jgi:competence protein ComEA
MRVVLNVLFIVALVATLAGGTLFLLQGSDSDGVQVVLPTPSPTETNEIKVHVTGAVNAPGVYTLWDGARVDDAIAIAGGASSEADLEAVNLALKVRDEDKVTIPRQGEIIAGVSPPPSGVITSSGGSRSIIDLNTADATALTSLPGIGEGRAHTIIAHREQNGPFTRIEDLLEISGIGSATLEAIRNLVVVR